MFGINGSVFLMTETISLLQIRAVIAVCEERSFTRAAARENAAPSGISQHIAAVERALGVALFWRSTAGVTPTAAGTRYYRRCVDAVGAREAAGEERRTLAGRVSGPLRVGLMPTFTRAALAPALKDYVRQHPDVTLRIVEGYSGLITDMVLAAELDFAVGHGVDGRTGLIPRR